MGRPEIVACRATGEVTFQAAAPGDTFFYTNRGTTACNLDRKNPRAKEDITHRPPEALVQDILAKERQIVDIMSEIAAMLEKGKVEGRDRDG